MFDEETRRRELAEFLRSKRKRLKPVAAGLHAGRRRLTPGLRREEVAELAGVGTTWYTWLEQARDIRPSEITLQRISRALQLRPVERKYLFSLALEHPRRTDREEVATPVLLSIVSGIRSPAFVFGQWWDLIAYNAAANALLDLDYDPVHNGLRHTFTPQARALYPHWPQYARLVVGLFRARNAGMLGHPAVVKLISELRQCSEHFRVWWAEQEVCDEMYGGHLTYQHPFVGRMSFEFELLEVLESPNLTLHVQVCDGAETCERLDELLRQQQNGQHTASHNLWTALAPLRNRPLRNRRSR
jgi:transcriptional regulator with XRE-family HTH domain